MNTTHNLQQLLQLRLNGMAKNYEAILQLPINTQPEGHEMIATLLQSEIHYRRQSRTNMLLKLARLRYNAQVEQITCSASRNLSKQQLAQLADCSFIERSENLLITGATGSGKSYLACAIGQQACLMGHKTYYMNMNKFCERIMLAKMDGTYLKLMTYFEKVKLLILDDFGLQVLDQNIKLALLQILEDSYEKKSVIITSQLPIGSWHEYINEPTLADAIMDRVTAQAHRIELKGESLRKKSTKIIV
jgi:DNA replication protein DnaC